MFKYCLNPSNIIFTHQYTNLYTNIAQPFELNSIGEFHCDNSYFTTRDNLNCCLLIYTLEGEGYIEYGNSKINLPPDSIVIINCNHYQLYKTYKNNWRFLWFHFHGTTAYDLVNEINEEGLFCGMLEKELFLSDFQSILSWMRKETPNSPFEISLVIHKLLAKIMAMKISSFQNSNEVSLNSVFEYITQNYAKKITIEELAQRVNLSKFYFIKLFRKATGTTPYKYILSVRISNAKELLLSTDYPISEIAEKCGFYDSNNFIQHFKSIVHCTPNHFRKNYFKTNTAGTIIL